MSVKITQLISGHGSSQVLHVRSKFLAWQKVIFFQNLSINLQIVRFEKKVSMNVDKHHFVSLISAALSTDTMIQNLKKV